MKILNAKEIDVVSGANLNCQEGYYAVEYCTAEQHALPPHRRICSLKCEPLLTTNTVTTAQFIFVNLSP